MKNILVSLSATVYALFSLSLNAQQVDRAAPFFLDEVSYDPRIPRPETVIGHPLGYRIARNDLLVTYMQAIAKSPANYCRRNRSYPRRTPYSWFDHYQPENHARDEIRAAHVA